MADETRPSRSETANRCVIVIFGASGDLNKRKLVPALCNLVSYGLMPDDYAILGVSRTPVSDSEFREQLRREIAQLSGGPVDAKVWEEFARRIYYLAGDINDPQTYKALAARISELAKKHQTDGNILYYLATPPQAFAPIVRHLGDAKLAQPQGRGWVRVIVEKPFGTDLESARELNRQLDQVLSEDQIYRIDHYLGKETVQNIFVLRFANGIFEPVWNRRYVDHVQLMVAEDLGIEGRGAFYDQTGALRDVIQNHMFQLLALVAMEPPVSFQGEGVRNEKEKVLSAIRPLQPEEILSNAARGQYGPGIINGDKVPGYRSEAKVSANSKTETFAALKLFIDNWRWAGVPFYLRSGKRLARRDTEIVIQFNRPPLLFFRQTGLDKIESNRLIIHVQPDEGIRLRIKAKVPGPEIQLKTVELHFNYQEFGVRTEATGYERLLHDCMIGDSTLFHREDMVETAWRVVTPILDVWASLPPRDFPNYPAGSWGPLAADELIARDGRQWIVSE
jgi:glucose-6-phosphate 1-dehydrogenase